MIQIKFAEKIKTHFCSLNYFQKIMLFIRYCGRTRNA